MRFRKIKTRKKVERITDKRESKKYRNIKPETDITFDEATQIWADFFMQLTEENIFMELTEENK
jgi:hypothetical protein